jgi:hypothetical protein
MLTAAARIPVAGWTVLAALAATFLASQYFDAQRTPGSRFVFDEGFVGVYCLVVSPEHPGASTDTDGYSVYTFDSHGLVRTSTYPAGKGALSKTEYLDHRHNTYQSIHSRSPCGFLAFGDRSILIGTIGTATCPKYNVAKPPSFEQALEMYCRQ